MEYSRAATASQLLSKRSESDPAGGSFWYSDDGAAQRPGFSRRFAH